MRTSWVGRTVALDTAAVIPPSFQRTSRRLRSGTLQRLAQPRLPLPQPRLPQRQPCLPRVQPRIRSGNLVSGSGERGCLPRKRGLSRRKRDCRCRKRGFLSGNRAFVAANEVAAAANEVAAEETAVNTAKSAVGGGYDTRKLEVSRGEIRFLYLVGTKEAMASRIWTFWHLTDPGGRVECISPGGEGIPDGLFLDNLEGRRLPSPRPPPSRPRKGRFLRVGFL